MSTKLTPGHKTKSGVVVLESISIYGVSQKFLENVPHEKIMHGFLLFIF